MVTEEVGAEFVVVERLSRKRDRVRRETRHIADVALLMTGRALCGREFDNKTLIPLSSWGKSDTVEGMVEPGWCSECREFMDASHPVTAIRRAKKLESAQNKCGRSGVVRENVTPQE